MKKVLLLAVAFVATMASAQVLNVASVEKLDIPANADSKIAGISPDGAYVLITSQSNAGLQQFDLASKKVIEITDAEGAGYNVEFSADSKAITYREVSYAADRTRMTALKSYDVETAKKATLVKATRDVNQARAKRAIAPTVVARGGKIEVALGTVVKELTPNGQGAYIWASLSPNGSKILYYCNGVWVCNVDGSNPKRIGNFRAPQWYNNNVVVGMNDEDNGYVVTSSSIVAYTLDGTEQVLTNGGVMAMYPYVSADGSKIVCSTPAGEAYLINIK